MKRRSRARIVYELLRTLDKSGPQPPTRLATLLGLSYDRLRVILEELEKRGYVALEKDGRRQDAYITTQGRRALTTLSRALRMLEELGLEP